MTCNPKPRYFTVSSIGFELMLTQPPDQQEVFNRVLWQAFSQLCAGQPVSYEPPDNQVLRIALEFALDELETGFRVYRQRTTARCKSDSDQRMIGDPSPVDQRSVGDPSPSHRKKDNNRKTGKDERTFFKPPTTEDVSEYCQEIGSLIDPDTFIDYYRARNWQLKAGVGMKDWQAAVRNWERRRKENADGVLGTGRGDQAPGQRSEYRS